MTTPLDPLPETDRAALLAIARGAILAHVDPARIAPALPSAGRLATEARGVFVTVRDASGAVRGAVGSVAPPAAPLAAATADLAIRAATEDPRFPPVGPAELDALAVSVAVLGPLEPLAGPEALRVGRAGVLVSSGWHRGVLLPRAAVEGGWDAATFLTWACLDAGLPASAWRDPETTMMTFEVEEFSA